MGYDTCEVIGSICRILVASILNLEVVDEIENGMSPQNIGNCLKLYGVKPENDKENFCICFFSFKKHVSVSSVYAESYLMPIHFIQNPCYQVPDNLSLLTVNKSCFHEFPEVNSQFETPGGRLNVFCLFCHLVVVVATVINK